MNQRLLIGYEPTLIRFGSDILYYVINGRPHRSSACCYYVMEKKGKEFIKECTELLIEEDESSEDEGAEERE